MFHKKLLSLSLLFLVFFFSRVANASSVIIPKGTELVGELVTPINSKSSKKGDPIVFKLAQNFIYKNAIILEKGTSGQAVVTHAEKATYFGQGGQVGFSPKSITTSNGIEIPLTFETQIRGDAQNDANMVIATIGVGIFASFFHGKNQSFPVGTKFKIFVEKDTDLHLNENELPHYFYMLSK